MNTRYLSRREMEDLLSISPTTFKRIREREQLPYLRVGGQLRFPVDEIIQILRTRDAI